MSVLPPNVEWLNTIGVLPKMIENALQYLGVREVKGAASNPVIMDMAKGLGVSDIYTNDDMAWCAVFVNHIIRISGKPIDLNPPDRYDLIRALKTAPLFDDVLPFDQWKLGDIIILKRKEGGHVFFPIAATENGKGIIGLGGNQSNMVTFSEFDVTRIVAVKRYYKTAMPASAKQYVMSSTGMMSTNEA